MKDGRFYDALRPTVEPKGYESMAEYAAHRADHLSAVRRLFEEATLVVFTLGLTEAWVHRQTGTVYPTAPGTVAGTHDPSVFAFKNFDYLEVLRDLRRIRRRLKAKQPKVRMLVTVSPVPLTATASDQHVLAATTYSKSVLRAAAGTFASEHEDVDYFPSYEIIAGIQARGFFYENNLRSVASEGVKVVMSTFFDAHKLEGAKAAPKEEPAVLAAPKPRASAARRGVSPLPILGAAPAAASTAAGKPQRAASPERDEEDVVCEDALLEAFAR